MQGIANDKFWFEVDTNEVPDYLSATVSEMFQRQDYKRQDELRHFKLYSNQNANGYRVADYVVPSINNGLVLNIVQAITDTLVSKIGKSNPRITFLTDKGNWEMKKRAENLEMFIQGAFYKTDLYNLSPRVLKRSCVFGTGLAKVFNDGKKIFTENVFPGEVWVDDRESIDGSTRTLYQIKHMSKVVLKKLYPKYEKEILNSAEQEGSRNYLSPDSFYTSAMIVVIEAWRLPTFDGAKDGRHIISISNCVLLDESWNKNYFPIINIKFSEKLLGFWGAGVAELLTGIQLEINKTIKRIQQSIHINAVPRVFYEYSSKIVKEHFSNEVGSMVGYRGTMPQIVTSQSVSADVFSHLDRLYQKAFEIIGMSQLSVAAQKPAGLNSAVSIREYHDIESERFVTLQAEYDKMHLECAKQYIENAKEIAAKNPNFAVMVKAQGGAINIKWKDVHMDEDAYIMQMYPTNLLPQQPAGRLEKVIEMTNSQLINPQEATTLLDYPDLKSITTLKNAKIDDIMLTVSEMLEKGKYYPPEPYQDLNAGIEYMTAFYLLYKHQKVKPERLDLLTRWIGDAQKLLTPPQPEPAPSPAPAPELGDQSQADMLLPNSNTPLSAMNALPGVPQMGPTGV